ncbi:unnamed protein product [Bursaphelenchus okinawaensis]|uniref:DNA-directed primase/polymerase protein n=1 Tax=Bursaphelenchus okinawaensis TaxID=465554 RepID=A0A811LN43_9BILA|nr:unnamed protein product [Bursaphelenchus okinawaensis]CAG9126838.1 unnamed protein product [Bursaphelenchus okinawaensis]
MASLEECLRQYFVIYYRQQDAFNRQQAKPSARVFTYETPQLTGGRRRFLSTDLEKFLRCYKLIKCGRHFYELIQEGRPCRPYFDLEYYKEFNPYADSKKLVKEFIQIVRDLLKEKLDITLDETDFLILDSSSDTKFSAHIIIHFKDKVLLPSNTAFKLFVNILCTRLTNAKKCILWNKDKEVFLCDTGVYTKNRNFRLAFSSKCGKKEKLVYADYCNFYQSRGISYPRATRIFYDSLIIPKDYEEYDVLDLKDLGEWQSNCFSLSRTVNGATYRNVSSASGPSPFPVIDAFIKNILIQYCPKIQISKWELLYFEEYNSRRLQLYFANCRYCFHIKREHKSQNITWIVYLDQLWAHQKCFDEDCRWFSFPRYLFPDSVKRTLTSNVVGKPFQANAEYCGRV